MPLARYRAAGIRVGLGSDVAGAPELSIVAQMRAGFFQQNRAAADGAGDAARSRAARVAAAGHARGAGALGLDEVIGSLEPGKEADLIAVDPLVRPAGARPR